MLGEADAQDWIWGRPIKPGDGHNASAATRKLERQGYRSPPAFEEASCLAERSPFFVEIYGASWIWKWFNCAPCFDLSPSLSACATHARNAATISSPSSR